MPEAGYAIRKTLKEIAQLIDGEVVGDANVVPRHKPQIAAALALAGEYSGHRIIFYPHKILPRLII